MKKRMAAVMLAVMMTSAMAVGCGAQEGNVSPETETTAPVENTEVPVEDTEAPAEDTQTPDAEDGSADDAEGEDTEADGTEAKDAADGETYLTETENA